MLYHTLQGSSTCGTYILDAEQRSDKELAQFFRQAQEQYDQLARKAKQMLKEKLA